MAYPPFARLINLRLEGNSEGRLQKYAQDAGKLSARISEADRRIPGRGGNARPGPGSSGPARGKWRCQMLFKGEEWGLLHQFMELLLAKAEEAVPSRGVKLIVDVDPVNML